MGADKEGYCQVISEWSDFPSLVSQVVDQLWVFSILSCQCFLQDNPWHKLKRRRSLLYLYNNADLNTLISAVWKENHEHPYQFSLFSWWCLYPDHYWATDSQWIPHYNLVNIPTTVPVSHSHSRSCRWRQIPLQLPDGSSLQSRMMHHTITQLMLTQHSAPCLQLSSLHMPKMRSILAEPCTDLSICNSSKIAQNVMSFQKWHKTCYFKDETKYVTWKMTKCAFNKNNTGR